MIPIILGGALVYFLSTLPDRVEKNEKDYQSVGPRGKKYNLSYITDDFWQSRRNIGIDQDMVGLHDRFGITFGASWYGKVQNEHNSKSSILDRMWSSQRGGPPHILTPSFSNLV